MFFQRPDFIISSRLLEHTIDWGAWGYILPLIRPRPNEIFKPRTHNRLPATHYNKSAIFVHNFAWSLGGRFFVNRVSKTRVKNLAMW